MGTGQDLLKRNTPVCPADKLDNGTLYVDSVNDTPDATAGPVACGSYGAVGLVQVIAPSWHVCEFGGSSRCHQTATVADAPCLKRSRP